MLCQDYLCLTPQAKRVLRLSSLHQRYPELLSTKARDAVGQASLQELLVQNTEQQQLQALLRILLSKWRVKLKERQKQNWWVHPKLLEAMHQRRSRVGDRPMFK